MRRVVMLNRVSIDGFFASLNEQTWGMDWFVQDTEVDIAVREGGGSDTLILGGITYRGFERSWVPRLNDPDAPKELKAVAEELTKMTKVVFSKTLNENEITWANTKLFKGNPAAEVRKLKQGNGTDILIFGSGSIVQQLANAGLIDDYFFILTPVIAGDGKPLFKAVKQLSLKLLQTRSFKSGNVLLRYEAV